MTPEVKAKLAELAPNIAFKTSKELDPSFVWDGDGPDPEDEGLSPYDVTFTATTIIGGELIECSSYLGGCYMMQYDEAIGDCGGYLLQSLEEAAKELLEQVNQLPIQSQAIRAIEWHNGEIKKQLRYTLNWLKEEMKRRYDEQMTPATEA